MGTDQRDPPWAAVKNSGDQVFGAESWFIRMDTLDDYNTKHGFLFLMGQFPCSERTKKWIGLYLHLRRNSSARTWLQLQLATEAAPSLFG
jgi:hypothetical protein